MRKLLFALFTLFFLNSCKNDNALFTELSDSDTGINFRNTLFEDGPLNVANYIYFYNGGGVAVGDINNDGLQDILFTGNMVRNRLFLNKGNFQFEDITKKAGVDQMQGWCTGATMSDVNNDGKLDIYICRSADINPDRRKNLLFINNGDLSFTEKAEEYGLADNGYSTMASFLDYDKDGDLDCFIINHSIQKYTAGVQDNPELRKERNPDYASKLYRNDLIPPIGGTKGGFTNVSDQEGIFSNVLTFGLGVTVSDFNNDGWPDISVSNDFNEPDYFFENNGKVAGSSPRFTEKLVQKMDNISLYSMGTDAADYDNDGNVDLLTLDMMPEDNKTIKMHSGPENFDKFQFLFRQGFYYQFSRNMLQRNNGDGTFSEVGQLAGVSNTDWSWAGLFSDFDKDGFKDLFVTNGYVKDYTEMDFLKYSVDRVIKSMAKDSANVDPIPEYLRKMPKNETQNYAFKNKGDGTFQKMSNEWGFTTKGVSAGAAYADLDNDGDLDLIVNNTNALASIYKNNAEKLSKNNYLSVKLNGGANNRFGIGAKVKLYCKGQLMYQEQSPVRGFQSSNDPVLNFGVGENTTIDSLIVIWMNDSYQKLTSVKTNQVLELKIADAKNKWVYPNQKPNPIFTQSNFTNVIHKENGFNDFTVQSLLPNYFSRQGPFIEVADINNDGLDDFFIGGAKGESSQLFIQNKNNTFSKINAPVFAQNAGSEDVAGTFFDADNDGDKDLYVAAGGYEFEPNDPLLQDRLYLNDGKGNYSKSENALPKLLASKGCVKATDIDSDGDLDLFVGGRIVPRRYPEAPNSYILINDGKGHFIDNTQKTCAALSQIGMVTDAVWMDVNNDKQQDMIVVGEWMPIKVFINSKGKLTDKSEEYIHFASTGWWNKINATDMDGDGDLDLIIGNCGLNTQFKVNDKEPMTVHYKDFTNNGQIVPVLSYYINGVSYPMASRDDLADPMPFIKKKFNDYKSYSTATITDVFSPEELKDAKVLKAETMQTVYLENQGAKGFTAHALPMEAQYAPVSGIIADDFDNDGKKDLLLAGGNTWTRIKFGRYLANHGVLLLGDGKNNFKYAPQSKSGLNLRGNIRSLQTINSGKTKRIIVGVNDGEALMLGRK